MTSTTSIYLEAARFWYDKWKDELERKNFEEAERYFVIANRWKRRAKLEGMLSQICEARGI